MDDELKAKVDDAITSLQKHMEAVSGEPASKEDAAIAIHNYATPRGVIDKQVSLTEAVDLAVSAKRRSQSMNEVARQEYAPGQAKLLAAFAALAQWQDYHGQCLRHEHMAALWESAFWYIQGTTQFLGQESGIELRTKRDVKKNMPLRKYLFAAASVVRLNKQDPDSYPMTQSTFDKIGELHNVSGSRVRDFIYSKEGKRILPELSDSDLFSDFP